MPNTAWRAGASTDTGKQRDVNEDAFLCEPEEGFFAAIDGVGGYAGGEVASAEARDAIRRRLLHRTGTPETRLREAVTNANNKIFWRSQEETQFFGMACVLTVVLLEDGQLFAAHVGDTRLYKIRDRRIEKLTRDHSFVGIQEDRQELNEYDAMHHPRRNEILRDVGSEHHDAADDNFIDIVEASFEPDAALLLCSDGLTDLVPARELLRLTQEHAGAPQAAAEALVQAANDAGGTDNITVVVVEGPRFGDAPVEAPPRAVSTPAPSTPPPASLQPAPRPSPWRFYAYGFATALALAATVYILWLAREAPAPPDPTILVEVVPDSLPGAINALLAAAQPGDTVVVPAGVYRETVRLRSGIVVRSAGPDAVRLIPPADSARTDTVAVLAEAVTDAALIGFTIGPDTTAEAASPFAVGILVRRAAVRLDRVTVTGTARAGVHIDPRGEPPFAVTLHHSTIVNNSGVGVLVEGNNGNVRLVDNTVRANAQAGVVLLDEARLDLRGNTILGNGGANIEIRLDTTIARLRTMNTVTGDDQDTPSPAVRVVGPRNQNP